MILKTLKLTNFKKYTDREFIFRQGLCGIVGKNGSGKSTIFEAILFALYGELKNRGSKEIIKNANASSKDSVSVELNFLNSESQYKLIREFRGKTMSATAKLYKNEELVVSGAKEVTNEIVSLTKMNKNAFLHTIFASQKELSSLSNLKPEERKKMIRKLLGLEKIDFIQGLLVEKGREIKRELNAFKEFLLSQEDLKAYKSEKKENEKILKELFSTLKETESDLKKLQEKLAQKEQKESEFQKIKEQKQQTFNQIEILKNYLENITKNIEKLKEELKQLNKDKESVKELEPFKKEYEEVKQKLKTLQELKEKQIKKEGLLKEQDELRESYKKIKARLQNLSDEVAKKAQITKALEQSQKESDALQQQIKQITTKIKQTEANISSEQGIVNQTKDQLEKIKSLGKDSACPTCTRPLLDEYEGVVKNLSQTIDSIQTKKIAVEQKVLTQHEKNLQSLQEQNKEYEKKINEIKSEIKLIQSKEKDLLALEQEFKSIEQKGHQNNEALKLLEKVDYDAKLHEKMLQQEKELQPKYEKMQSLQIKLQRLEIIEKEIKEQEKELSQKESENEQKQKEHEAIQYDEKEHEKIKSEIGFLKKDIDSSQEEIAKQKVQAAQLEGKVENIDQILQKNDKELDKLKQKELDLNDYEKLKLYLEEFKTKLNSKITPRIGSLGSELFSQITHQKYQRVEVDDEFDFYIYDEGVKYPIDRFSGGEVDLANLVLRISISKTLSELSSVDLGFLAYDEVFGSQDENRRMQIMEAFHTIKEKYRQIFLISHEESIKQMLENVIEV